MGDGKNGSDAKAVEGWRHRSGALWFIAMVLKVDDEYRLTEGMENGVWILTRV